MPLQLHNAVKSNEYLEQGESPQIAGLAEEAKQFYGTDRKAENQSYCKKLKTDDWKQWFIVPEFFFTFDENASHQRVAKALKSIYNRF